MYHDELPTYGFNRALHRFLHSMSRDWHILCYYKIRVEPGKILRALWSQVSIKERHGRRVIMKTAISVLLTVIIVGLAPSIQAASVTFEPREVTLKVAPGKTGRTAILVHGFSNRAYSLNFLVGSKMKNGNIPGKWLTAAYLWLDSKTEGASSRIMNLVVTVPPDATPGTYSGLIVPDDMRCSEPITSPGVFIAIEVSDS